MSCLWNVLFMKFPVYEISYLWNVMSMKCPVYEMSCLWDNLSVKCLLCNVVKNSPMFYISCLWNVLSLKYPVFFKFLLFSMKCPAPVIYCLWNILSEISRLLCNDMSYLCLYVLSTKCREWNFYEMRYMKCPVY